MTKKINTTTSTAIAKALCTAEEFKIYEASTKLKKVKPDTSRVKQKIVIARKLRDKYTDLSRSQKREMLGKTDPKRKKPAKGNEGSKKKAALFLEVLSRFENYLNEIEVKTEKTKTPTSQKAIKPVKRSASLPNKKVTSDSKPIATKKTVSKTKNKSGAKDKKTKSKKTTKSLSERLEAAKQKKSKMHSKKSAELIKSSNKKTIGLGTKMRLQKNRSRTIQSHVRASGSRNQAKRDSK
ncbi:MAG TPA: hypothetical protein PKA63_00795 [Oligoflexia bacterium]|nr:hypothetical protein [Oligoflexia bacterium]HMP47187.1 hypothetical protein [Oligoflexia bacterium]